MKNQIFILIIIFLGLFQSIYGQDKNFQIGLRGSFVPEGSELSSSYTIILGIEGKYFFKDNSKFKYYGTTGFSKDLDGTAASITLIDLGIGVQYNLFKIKDRPFYATLNAGGLYIHEEFSVQLIERVTQSTFNKFGYTANLGVGYYIFNNINVQFNINRLNDLYTTLRLSLYYNF
tara:strand:- start:2015 stop:2539 length:525 start_codon:yes stop_codon:yes gene_type:complete